MDYREEKFDTIEKLQQDVNASTTAQSDAKAKYDAANSALTLMTNKYNADNAQKETAYNNASLANKALSSAELAAEISGGKNGASEVAVSVYDAVQTMTANTYLTASMTAELADLAGELADTVAQMKKDNNLISDLLVKDASSMPDNGKQALSDAIAALNAAVTALDSASHGVEDADSAASMETDLVKRSQWLSDQLNGLLEDARTVTEAADKRKSELKKAVEEANRELIKANAQLASAQAALSAAKAATGQK